MKKLLAIILGLTMCAALAACGSTTTTSTETTTATTVTEAETVAEETAEAAEETSEAADAEADADDDDPYLGHQFAGEDPWGGELSVTVRTLEDDTMDWTFTMVNGETTLYQEVTGTELTDNKGSFEVSGEVTEPTKQTFEYSGTIELKDGTVVVTFEDGAVTSESENGGGSAWQVKALDDSAKVVTLELQENN